MVGVDIKQNARCCCAKYTAKWTCKIVDFPRNCEMETVVTCSTTDDNGSCHGLALSIFDDMTRYWRQQIAGYGNKIATNAPAAALHLIPALGDRSNGTLPTSNTSSAMTRIDQSSAITKMYAYEIKQNLSKIIFLLLGRRHYDGFVHCFFLLSLEIAFVLIYEK